MREAHDQAYQRAGPVGRGAGACAGPGDARPGRPDRHDTRHLCRCVGRDRGDGHAPRRNAQQSAAVDHRAGPGGARSARDQGHRRSGPRNAGHPVRSQRFRQPDQHRHSRGQFDRRRGDDRGLYRRHPDPEPGGRLFHHQRISRCVRSDTRRSLARAARHAVRCRFRRRHGALHHHPAQPRCSAHLCARRSFGNAGRRRLGRVRGVDYRSADSGQAGLCRQLLGSPRWRLGRPAECQPVSDRPAPVEERQFQRHPGWPGGAEMGAARRADNHAVVVLPAQDDQRQQQLLGIAVVTVAKPLCQRAAQRLARS